MRQALISKSALLHNLSVIRQRAAGCKLMAYLKANAYGHGLDVVGPILSSQVDGVTVTQAEEAIILRRIGFEGTVVLTSMLLDEALCREMAALEVDLVIFNIKQINHLKGLTAQQAVRVWLKVNTGMNRLGIAPTAVKGVIADLQALDGVKNIILMSHLANADVPEHPLTVQQTQVFQQLIQHHQLSSCLVNSAGIFTLPGMHVDWVRFGISLYGVSPFSNRQGQDLNLRPVMQLRAQIVSVQALNVGDAVGYGSIWTATQNTYIAVVALGYADGVPWRSTTEVCLQVNGAAYPVVGRVSMDLLTIDIGMNIHQVKAGDWAVLWGPGAPVEQVAKATKTIPYELLSQVGMRVNRVMVEDVQS